MGDGSGACVTKEIPAHIKCGESWRDVFGDSTSAYVAKQVPAHVEYSELWWNVLSDGGDS